MSPTAAAAAKAAGDAWNEGKVKQQQGERLYPLVCRLLTHGDVAPEHITGMLLDMPINHVEGLIADPDQLTKRIAECRDVVLRQRDAEASRFTTALAAAAAELGVDHSRLLDDVREVVDQWALAVTQQQGLPDDRAAAHLYVYGSYLLGVAGPESDVDVMIAVPAHICRVRHFFGLRAKDGDGGRGGDSLLERLRADKRVTDLMAVPDAFVPCIKLQFSGVDVDLTFANLQMPALPQQPATRASWAADIDHLTRSILSDLAADAPSLRSVNGVRASHALLKVVPDSVTFRRTLRMVKTWAQVRGVYGNTVGFLGGMSWAILTAKICQDFPGISPEHTLALFFRVYVSWQWPSAVRLRGCLPPNASEKSKALDDAVWNPDINPDDLRHHMPIITPIYPCMNSTFNLAPPNFRVVKSELDRAALITGPVLSGGVLAGSLHQSGRAFFFSRYEWYLQLDVVAADAEGTRKWMGLVQALLRHLIRTLESTRLFLVHPWPDLVVVKPEVKSETVRSLSNKKGKRPQPPKPAQSAYFLGLITEDGSSLSAPISEAVAEFQRLATMRAAGWYHKGMAVKEHVVRRSELPKCVKDEVESLTEPGNIPGRAVNHTDFCSGVDEHQLNLRETALMARNTGVAASKVPNIMSKRLAATSELERSRATEAQCTHDNLLVTCEELRAEKQSALQRLEAMKHTERRLTDKSKEQDKQRKKAEKAAKTSWRGQKEELESDLDNLRAALDKSNARANAAEKENRKLQASLAQAREEGRERPDTKSKSKSRERADTKTPSPPQSGKKNKGKERSKAAAKQPSNDGRKQTAAAETKPKPRRPSSGVATSGAATGKRRWAPGALLAEMQQRLQLSKMETLKPVLALLVAVVVAGLLAQTATRGGLLHGNQTGLDSICASLPCQHNGLCSAEGNDSYSCTCLDGFHGSACEHGEQGPGSSFNPSEWFEEAEKASVEPVADTEVCGDGPCLNGGVCETSLDFSGGPSDGKTCRCKEGYTGSSCETKLNVCQSMPCRNDGTCVDATSSYVCHCRHPWCAPAAPHDACSPAPALTIGVPTGPEKIARPTTPLAHPTHAPTARNAPRVRNRPFFRRLPSSRPLDASLLWIRRIRVHLHPHAHK